MIPYPFRHCVRLLAGVAALWANQAFPQVAPVPPPLAQQGADCARPQYASDALVCSDAQLRALDSEVAALAQTPTRLASGPFWEDQSAWMRRRSRCAFERDHRACLAAAYADRLSILTAVTATAVRPLRCDGVWRGLALLASEGDALIVRADSRPLTVATTPAKAWQPWVAMKQAGRRITFQPQQGPAIHCRLR